MNAREIIENREQQVLAPYAQLAKNSLGRTHKEGSCPLRTCFYRDLGRIVHSTAFRLLEYKTQVFVNHEGDYYRTRLTHSLEVAQISQGLARIFRVNEDLAQTIALSHDLGHTPFGHTGEHALNALMTDEGGFEHNVQSYRVVTELEDRYPDFRGLNLSYEVLEGILKHTTDYDAPHKVENFKDVGHPTIEAQIVNFADQIAYMNHDLDDGLHWGMLSIDSLKEVSLWAKIYSKVEKDMPTSSPRIKRCRTISALINTFIEDLRMETEKRIALRGIKTLADVRERGEGLVGFGEALDKKAKEAKAFLFENVYRHPEVTRKSEHGGRIVRDLFMAYRENPKLIPDKYRERLEKSGSLRHIADYVAGMTDRFAIAEHKKLFDRVYPL